MAGAVAERTGITEVEVITRWRGCQANGRGPNGEAGERVGIPEALAKELAAMNPPVVRIVREHVPVTEGIGRDGKIGSDASVNQMDALIGLVGELVAELRDGRRK